MKIEKNYFMANEEFAEIFHVFQINLNKEEPDFLCKGSYTNFQEALRHFYKLCKKQKDSTFRIEPCDVFWYEDAIGKTFFDELNTNFKLGNDDIFISNYVKGWESYVKKLLRRKQ